MSAFRDETAFAEQLERLREENRDLRSAVLRLREEISRTREASPGAENEAAFVTRLEEEEAQLRAEIGELKELVASCEADLTAMRSGQFVNPARELSRDERRRRLRG